MPQRIADLLVQRAARSFLGRERELAFLRGVLSAEGPRVVHVFGIAGIGKSSLLEMFSIEAQAQGAIVLRLDCRAVEPTETAFLHALCERSGNPALPLARIADRLAALGAPVVLALDTCEVFRLLDTWLRQNFIPALPDNVRVLLFGRERPLAAWQAEPGWQHLFRTLPLGPLPDEAASALLGRFGVPPEAARRIARGAHGHPLALHLAACAYRERPDLALETTGVEHALDALTRMFLADVGDPLTRRVLEGAAVLRRATVSLLDALFPQLAPGEAFECVRRLPFVECGNEGLVVHDVVREAVARSLRARDPAAYLGYQHAAWHQLRVESASAGRAELWRYTADMLYLIENPVVREAFFPVGTQRLAVEPARGADGAAIARIIESHEGPEAARHLLSWWQRAPQAFSVVRDPHGQAIGLCCKLTPERVAPADLLDDPLTAAWGRHIERSPMPPGQTALLCRRWLSLAQGEAPSDVQAAAWLDLKRTYMELRPMLRRVYLTVRDLLPYAAAAERLGFTVLPDAAVLLDGQRYHSAVLDFGPSSVDGWLAGLAADEIGIRHTPSLLDVEARELVVGARRVALTPLEFGVMAYLAGHEGKAVSRSELLREVWGTRYEGGSNVVDTIVHALRHKLGARADGIETVSGVGYRLRREQ
ncbi:winged helix-turn-helix domain-containing protein [Azoarcus sp. PA01]|nr:winged helix-turn-helix domain-containing protein [Azoarcus sp. PA01]